MDIIHRNTAIFSTFAAIRLGMMILSAGCTIPVQFSPPAAPASPEAVPDNGQPWKENVLMDLQGKGNFSIASFAGKTVILPAVSDSCPPCVILLSR